MLSICGLQTEWGTFLAGTPTSLSMCLQPFSSALCFAQAKSAKLLHSTQITSHSKMAFYIYLVYDFAHLRKTMQDAG